MPNAVDLHVHSTFSTYDGMGGPQAVVDQAVEMGWGAVCLTEHGWMGSAPVLYQAAKKAGIKPIIGCEMYVVPGDILGVNNNDTRSETRHLTVLALSFEGYQNLIAWTNESMLRENFYYKPRISLDKMIEIAPWPLHHNAVLSGCLGGELCQCLVQGEHMQFAGKLYVEACASIFPNFYIELQNHKIDKFYGIGMTEYDRMIDTEEVVRTGLLELATETGVPVILTNDSHYQTVKQRTGHMAMLSRKNWRKGAEAHEAQTSEATASTFAAQYIYFANYMRSLEKVATTLPTWAERESIRSIHDIVEEADVVLEPLDKFSYTVPRSNHADPLAEVLKRSKSRLKSLVQRHGPQAQERFDKEMAALSDFADYMLLVSDVIRLSHEAGIYTWTRGSAANSMVCYCLRIHDIDPIHYKLMSERFVNPARAKLPDIDIDFESHRRDDVVRMVEELMAEREGVGNFKAICTFSTVSNRAGFRLMAEAAGVDEEQVDKLAKLLPQMIDSGLVTDEEDAYQLLKDEFPELHDLVESVFDSVANVSQHACAYALGTQERPLSKYVPNYHIASSGGEVTQYNMKSIEALGFLKLDLLKLDSLTIMHNVARMLGKDIRWLDAIGQEESGIYTMDDLTLSLLREGRTEGIHSFQGATQRRGCLEVAPESVEDMVAIQGLFRPSGTRTGLDKHFVNRKHGREDWQSINEFVGQFLDESYGIAIFQEQIMEMGAAMGMTGEEIDDLYKAIKTAKGVGRGAKELFEEFEPTFRKYAKVLFPEDEADLLWAEWEKLQGYTFNRGHATSYAILGAVKMAYLAAHHPQEFYVALLDRYPNNPRYLAAAMREGFIFEQPDVNAQGGTFARGSDNSSIRIGLAKIKGVGPAAVNAITANQPFASIDDLRERTPGTAVKVTTIDALIAVGALESLGISGESDDQKDFDLMAFVPRKPKAFKGCKPTILPTGSERWEFLGLERGVTVTDGKRFVAKLFWIPEGSTHTTKTSASGKYDANILTVVDENGIPFDLIVSTEKEAESKLLHLLAVQARGAVICAEGQLAMPFLRGGNSSFKLWGIVGAERAKPQIWNVDDEFKKWVMHLAEAKRRQRRRAA